jgi:hypothetical protein
VLNFLLEKVTGLKFFIQVTDTAKIESLAPFEMTQLIKLAETFDLLENIPLKKIVLHNENLKRLADDYTRMEILTNQRDSHVYRRRRKMPEEEK